MFREYIFQKMTEVTYVKFRYTLPKTFQMSTMSEFVSELVKVFRTKSICVAGYEDKNKSGMETHPHIHIHFDTEDAVKNIRERFKTFLKKKEDFRLEETGNSGTQAKVYAMGKPKDEEGLLSESRFRRYVWKQGGRIRFNGEKVGNLDEEDIEIEIERARAEYDLNCENRKKALEKAEAKASNSTYAKIEKACENTKLRSFEDICSVALDVAVENEIAVNFSTLTGYCITYALKHKMINRRSCISKMTDLVGKIVNTFEVPEEEE